MPDDVRPGDAVGTDGREGIDVTEWVSEFRRLHVETKPPAAAQESVSGRHRRPSTARSGRRAEMGSAEGDTSAGTTPAEQGAPPGLTAPAPAPAAARPTPSPAREPFLGEERRRHPGGPPAWMETEAAVPSDADVPVAPAQSSADPTGAATTP